MRGDTVRGNTAITPGATEDVGRYMSSACLRIIITRGSESVEDGDADGEDARRSVREDAVCT